MTLPAQQTAPIDEDLDSQLAAGRAHLGTSRAALPEQDELVRADLDTSVCVQRGRAPASRTRQSAALLGTPRHGWHYK
jgi:hypothetical protein